MIHDAIFIVIGVAAGACCIGVGVMAGAILGVRVAFHYLENLEI